MLYIQVYCVVMTLAQTTIETTARYDLLVNALNTTPDLRSGIWLVTRTL
jgi:hypothetical protein